MKTQKEGSIPAVYMSSITKGKSTITIPRIPSTIFNGLHSKQQRFILKYVRNCGRKLEYYTSNNNNYSFGKFETKNK